jgi:hypothetical protein
MAEPQESRSNRDLEDLSTGLMADSSASDGLCYWGSDEDGLMLEFENVRLFLSERLRQIVLGKTDSQSFDIGWRRLWTH